MKHLLQFLFLAFVIASTLVLSSCSENKKMDPAPTTGKVNGQITPANSVTTVTATSTATPAMTATATPNTSGAYSFTNLAAGTYTLSFTPAAGYTAPATQQVSVTTGGITVPDPTNVTQSGGTATLTVDGATVVVSLVRAQLAFGDLTLTLLDPTGQFTVLYLSPFRGTAQTGSFAGFSNAQLRYTNGSAEWATPLTGPPLGSYSVTPVGTNPSRISGSFSATLQPLSGSATGTKAITGTFTSVAY
jgi:outer membrane murein-binding lipoprotein Lpp